MSFKIHTLDAKNQLQNYIWILEHTPSQTAIAIDPTEAAIVQHFCAEQQLHLTQIWLTHWHKDHIGGVPELNLSNTLTIYGPQAELAKIPFINHPLNDLDRIKFQGLEIHIMAVPGHTLGHIVYYIPQLEILFCGDTLFAMGCGRVFEGTHAQMYASLQKLAQLPEPTQVYCTHEYTLSNAQFALHVDPNNLILQQRAQTVKALREQGLCTLPSQISLERATNPFFRAKDVVEFQCLRELKDHF